MMRQSNKIDFGSVKVHKEALAELVAHAIDEIDGVSLVPKNILQQCLDLVGVRTFPGIAVDVGEGEEDVSIEVRLRIRYGLNIPEMAQYVQTTVKTVIQKTVNLHLKEISVDIQGIERRTA